ncbi:MAG: glutamate--tRNA ligase [Candidatus Helarchaeota archaeon]
MNDDLNKIIRELAIRNAIKHDGKASEKAVLGMFLGKYKEYKSQIKEIREIITEIIEDINSMTIEQLKSIYTPTKKSIIQPFEEKELPPLPNAEKYSKIIMRLAPYPSGPLHIGNARMVILNDYYIKRYKGKLILVFDDTIGSAIKSVIPEAYDLIPDDLRYLGVVWHEILYKSDRIGITYKYCKELLENNQAYVCTCNAKMWSENHRKKGIPCDHRTNKINENLEEWEKMLRGVYDEGEAVVRLKTGMDMPNPALRDNVIMRISNKIHPRVGDKYRVWPLLEFSWGIDDHLLGTTHILRGKDLIHEDRLESIIWDFFKWPKIEFIHYGLISFRGIKLSKTEARLNIEKGVYRGWSDPRIWSIQSLKKRGILAESIRDLILKLGLSLADIKLSPKNLYSINRSKIDSIANRYFFINEPEILTIGNIDKNEYTARISIHPDFPERGTREFNIEVSKNGLELFIDKSDAKKLRDNEILRLKDFLNIKIINRSTLTAEILPGGIKEFRNIIEQTGEKLKIIQWLPLTGNISTDIIYEDGRIMSGIAEYNCKQLEVNQIIQFERFGFCKVDSIKPKLKLYFTHK